ncbi:MAG: acetylxylan esterase, partial [Daejeonella sp.]
MKCIKSVLFFLLLFGGIQENFAQPAEQLVKVIVAPDHTNWTYHMGEKAKFTVSIIQFGNLLQNVKIKYDVGPERMVPLKSDSLVAKDGKVTIDGGTMSTPGFLRCIVYAEVDGKRYRGLATAGFDPELIKPAGIVPADFVQFWDKAKADLTKIPMDARMTLLPERSTELVNVYHLNVQNFRVGARLYGILC